MPAWPPSQSQTYDALTLTLESTIQITGVINQLPEGKTAPDNHELTADWFAVVGKAPGGEEAFLNKVNEVRRIFEKEHAVGKT